MLFGASEIAVRLILLGMLNTVQQTVDAINAIALRLRQRQAQARRRLALGRRRRPPIPRIRVNPILAGLNTREFVRHYRLDPLAVMSLLNELPLIEPHGYTQVGISAHLRLLATLNFLATGSFQHTIGALQGIAQPTLSRTVHMVVDEICRLGPQYILFPTTDAEIRKCKQDFYAIAQFPNCIGAIDCTHISIVPRADEDYIYRNRKGELSINVQMVCDANLSIWNINARYPGSVHDARILANSYLFDDMAEGPAETWLLGDSAYPLLPWLLTPLRNTTTPAEQKYNKAHIVTRNTIERAFGVIKSRFRCLHRTGGALLYEPEFCAKIVLACVILHNICIKKRIALPAEEAPLNEDGDHVNWGYDRREAGPPNASGLALRRSLVQNVFTV